MRADELATYRGREAEFESLGQTWRASRFDMNVMDDFALWAQKHLPDPIEVAERQVEKLAAEEYRLKQEKGGDEESRKARLHYLEQQQERLTRMAMEKGTSYLAWDSPEMEAVRRSPRGAAQLMYLLLKKHHEGMTPQQALNILVDANKEDLSRVMALIMGKPPKSAPPPVPTDPLGNA